MISPGDDIADIIIHNLKTNNNSSKKLVSHENRIKKLVLNKMTKSIIYSKIK